MPTTAAKPSPKKAQTSKYAAATGQAQGYSAKNAASASGSARGYTGAQGGASTYQAANMNAAGYNADTGAASNYTADQRQVGGQSTVKGQMEGLLSGGSRYLDIARQNSAQQSNKRGLLNSSMAAGAGERAAIEAAMPIATQDANTYNNQSLTNQGANNRAMEYNASNDQQMTLANQNARNSQRQFNAANQQQAGAANQQAQNQAGQYNASSNQQMGLANMDSQNQAEQFTAQQGNAMSQFNAGQRQQNNQFNAASENDAGQFSAQQQNAMEQANMQSDNQAGQFNAQAEARESEFNASQANEILQQQWSQESSQAHQQTMANLNASLEQGIIDQKAFANLRGQLLDSVSNIANETNINISEIQTGEFPPDAKSKMINQQMDLRDADMVVMEKIFQAQPMWSNNWSNLGSGEKDVLTKLINKRREAEKAAA